MDDAVQAGNFNSEAGDAIELTHVVALIETHSMVPVREFNFQRHFRIAIFAVWARATTSLFHYSSHSLRRFGAMAEADVNAP